MQKAIVFTSLSLAITLTTCRSNDDTRNTVIWNNGDGTPPAVFSSSQFSTSERAILAGGEIIRFSKQRIGPASVEGGGFQRIESAGQLRYGKLKYEIHPDRVKLDPKADLAALHAQRFFFLSELNRKNILPENSKLLSDPELVVLMNGSNLTPCYAIDLLNSNRRSVERYYYSPRFQVLKTEKVSSDFDARAWIYTIQNPDAIKQVLLNNLLDGPALQSSTHEVVSDSSETATAGNSPWKFPPDDPRFDQVQAFYFLRAGIKFFAKDLDFTIPMKVQAQTYLGYPDKIAVAFTYQNQIRIGFGDGTTFKNMARDPSIILHELGHVVTNLIAHLPTQKEGGSLNEAFADFFAASYLNNPKIGRMSYIPAPYSRNLEDFIPFTARNGGLYHDSQIVSGTLWQIRSTLGVPKTQKLAIRTLTRLGPATALVEFPAALKLAAAELKPEEIVMIDAVLQSYAWPR